MMSACIKQHLSNILSSAHDKVNQHWGWVEKKALLIKKSVYDYTDNKVVSPPNQVTRPTK